MRSLSIEMQFNVMVFEDQRFPVALMVETASGFQKISMTSSCDIPNFSGEMSRGFCNI